MKNLTDAIQAAWPVERFQNVGVVLGLSGGADSVALLVALTQLLGRVPGGRSGFLVAAHFNHRLRGDQSDRDEAFSGALARRLGVDFESGSAAEIARDEATMSAQRMRFLVQVAKQRGARYVTLAHSRDDNVETVLHHLMRGTGPAGLCGIGSPRPIDQDLVLVRPFLAVDRNVIRSGLRAIGQTWCEDASNACTDYRRNWIRHELIPKIQQQYPDAVAAIDRAVQSQRQWRQTIDELAQQYIDQHHNDQGKRLGIPQGSRGKGISHHFRRFTGTAHPVLVAAMQIHWKRCDWPRGSMTQQHWNRLANLLSGTPSDPPRSDPSKSGGDTITTGTRNTFTRDTGTGNTGHAQQRFDLPGGIDVVVAGDQVTLSRVSHRSG